MRTGPVALLIAAAFGLAACGSDDSATTSTTRGYSAEAGDESTLKLGTVLACLKKTGVDASEQSGLDDDDLPHIRIDYSGDNTLVNFYESSDAAAEDEDLQRSLGESYDSKVRRVGNVLLAEGPGQPAEVTAVLKSCVG